MRLYLPAVLYAPILGFKHDKTMLVSCGQAVLDAGVLPYLEVLLRHTKKNIRKVTLALPYSYKGFSWIRDPACAITVAFLHVGLISVIELAMYG